MSLRDSDETILLRDAVRRVLARSWPSEKSQEACGDGGAVRAVYETLAEQGFCGFGGASAQDGGFTEAVVVAEELGRAHCPAPVLDSYLVNALGAATGSPVDLQALFGEADAEHPRIGLPSCGLPSAYVSRTACTAGQVTGVLSPVEQGSTLDYVGVVTGSTEIAFVRCCSPAISVEPVTALDMSGFSRIRFDGAQAIRCEVPEGVLSDLSALSRLLHAARAFGAAERSFELVVDYCKTRVQFDRPIGQFQAIQHKLANCQIRLVAVGLLLRHAAEQKDADAEEWGYFAAAASAFAAVRLPEVSLETHHAFGAVGYSETHEAPRHFKRIHVDLLMAGGAISSRSALADRLLGPRGGGLPRPDLGAEANAFRGQVHDWLERNWSGDRRAAHAAKRFGDREFDREFAEDLGKTGWIGADWPTGLGGQGRGALEQIAFMEEMESHEVPRFGAPVPAAILMKFGTRHQQQRYLPPILAGRAMFGLGYSEPDAGSDLASLRTRAVRDGSDWIINGQKIWTTTYWGKYMLLAARTDPDVVPKQAGISLFIVEMDAPGITMNVDTTMYGGTFANVFYDDVRVAEDALLGEANEGWKLLTHALATERGAIGGGIVLKVAHLFELLCCLMREARPSLGASGSDPLVRDMIGKYAAEIEAGRQLMLACASVAESGAVPTGLAAASKVFSGELMEQFLEEALRLLGPVGTIGELSPGGVLGGRLEQALRHSLMWVISMGTNEVQRNLIAQRTLGLPR